MSDNNITKINATKKYNNELRQEFLDTFRLARAGALDLRFADTMAKGILGQAKLLDSEVKLEKQIMDMRVRGLPGEQLQVLDGELTLINDEGETLRVEHKPQFEPQDK